jgi:dihydroorotase/N-acyl-D-amino-acid deacylase
MPILLPILLFAAALQPYDLVIRNGRIVDGTGSPWYQGDVAVRGGKIAAIGHLPDAAARRTIDARGMVVAPGFIDMLGQSELTILVNPHLPSKIFQGSPPSFQGRQLNIPNDAIVKSDHVTYQHYGIQPGWRTFREYFARLRKQGLGINLASYVGATQVRRVVLGDDNRAPDAAELERMKALVRDGMRDGAVGLSTSLQYAPAPYARPRS